VSDEVEEGSSSPLGATPSATGVNFSVFSRHATGVELLLFDGIDDAKAARVVRLDPSAEGDPSSHSIAFTAKATMHRVSFHVMDLPTVSVGGRVPWRRWIDTFLDSPHDIVDWKEAPPVPGHSYRAAPRSVVVLFAGLPSD